MPAVGDGDDRERHRVCVSGAQRVQHLELDDVLLGPFRLGVGQLAVQHPEAACVTLRVLRDRLAEIPAGRTDGAQAVDRTRPHMQKRPILLSAKNELLSKFSSLSNLRRLPIIFDMAEQYGFCVSDRMHIIYDFK